MSASWVLLFYSAGLRQAAYAAYVYITTGNRGAGRPSGDLAVGLPLPCAQGPAHGRNDEITTGRHTTVSVAKMGIPMPAAVQVSRKPVPQA